MEFKIHHSDKDTQARSGTIVTDHGSIETPIFMPVGTLGTVKTIHRHELLDPIKAQIILGNTYHLYLRPGIDTIEQAGGLHKFIGWDQPLLTDSGGYQVYSLAHRRKITEEGVKFQSHIDGSRHFFSPESAVDVQRSIGADIIMAFDECTPYPCEYDYAKNSMKMTHRWLDRCISHFKKGEGKYGYRQTFSPIVQGSVYQDLRKDSAKYIADADCEMNAIGGLSVGEPHDMMYEMTEVVCGILPKSKPRYLMGVGTPENLLHCIALGIDMFDCVLPTRNARHGLLYTSEGIINIKNLKWKNDHSPIDEHVDCLTSQHHSKAYLRHLVHTGEALGAQISTLQNLTFFLWLMKEARKNIEQDTFHDWQKQMLKKVTTRL